ncbi:MAG: chorismate-binding protein [Mariprofundaceae bacterium]|nr:chorismate-binding protein [Mariprofundaceae bacterium]
MLSAYPSQYLALLEDPKGSGRDMLISSLGQTEHCSHREDAQDFLATWRNSLTQKTYQSTAIQCFIYANYEAVALFEDKINQPKTQTAAPHLVLHYPDWSMVFEHETQMIELCSNQNEKELDFLQNLLYQAQVPFNRKAIKKPSSIVESDDLQYQQAVKKVRSYIYAGDVFQSNIARFWQTPFPEKDLLDLYAALRSENPAPFSCYVDLPDIKILSASPERLFSLSHDGVVQTRPIAGTRKRGKGDDDVLLCSELLLSEKERAEHIMMVDLERNDLGRVCEPGSVHVDECMVIERYATVQHIVSNIQATLKKDHDVVDLFCAMFPGGTITGCPKLRCMQIIHELEAQARGPYTGGVGYIAWDGSADMNILIRTFWHDHGQLHWAAGAGIVADSDPLLEKLETEHKAEGLMRAFQA